MAWDEWEQAKESAAQGQSARMQLNHVPLDPGGSSGPGGAGRGWQPIMASSPEQMKTAATSLEDRITGTKDAGTTADKDTESAIKAFGPKDGDGWFTSGAIKKAHDTWGRQAKALTTRLTAERHGVQGTKKLFTGVDLETGLRVRSVSQLDTYSKID